MLVGLFLCGVQTVVEDRGYNEAKFTAEAQRTQRGRRVIAFLCAPSAFSAPLR